jgi:hypothetical protein
MTYPFFMPTEKKRKQKTYARKTSTKLKPAAQLEPPIGLVQGRKPGSVQEWRVALALYRLRIGFEYQKSISGQLLGGQIVDFWIDTKPYPTPCYVQGSYWHRRAKQLEDTYKQAYLQAIFKGRVAQNLILEEDKLTSIDKTYELLKEKLL